MFAALNELVDAVEQHPAEELDVTAVAAKHGTTEHHLRRMFSSLAGMPLSEYVRRRRMTVAAADVVGGDDLLGVSVRYGYGSVEAFGRAFRSVHGVGPGDVRRDGGPLRTQPQLRFRLTVEGSTPMHVRITDRPALRLVGHATRVPLIHNGVNPHIQEHVAAIPLEEHLRLKGLSNTTPTGLLQISDGQHRPGGHPVGRRPHPHGVVRGGQQPGTGQHAHRDDRHSDPEPGVAPGPARRTHGVGARRRTVTVGGGARGPAELRVVAAAEDVHRPIMTTKRTFRPWFVHRQTAATGRQPSPPVAQWAA